jgi:small-conductance mechanosensitive channel
MTQQQYDELVKAAGQSVVETLNEKGLIAKSPAPTSKLKSTELEEEETAVARVVSVLRKAPTALAGYPAVWANISRLPDRLDRTAAGGRGLWDYLGLLALVAAAALLVEFAVGRLTASTRCSIAQQFIGDGRLWRVAALALLDGLAFFALFIVVHLALGTWFAEAGVQTQFASIVLNGLVTWRLYLLLSRLYLRPAFPAARIAPVGDESAWKLYRLFGFAVLAFVLVHVLLGVLYTPSAIAAAIVTNSVIVPAIFMVTAFLARKDICGWFLGLIDEDARGKGAKEQLARHWLWFAIPLLIVLGLARAYEALSDRFEAPSVVVTLVIIIGLLLAETLLAFVTKRRGVSVLSGQTEANRLSPFVVRSLRVTVLVAAAAVLVRSWAVDTLALVDEQGWAEFSRAWSTTVITALIAYFAWEAVRFATERHIGRPGLAAHGQNAHLEEAQVSRSRLETLAPILRVVLGIAIAITAVMMMLTSLGINIAPLIAGASVVGLAISFGSQALVRDIVSGVFYLTDDAFRVGEYIDCGKAKGTVEGFTVRSIRLRHQNGQIYTIPYGQLGQIANFSRDWATLKFNLRFARDTDVETLRKVAKKVGLAMLEEPELKDDFLQPLKCQGIADIEDNAIVMRFKMTVRPVRPAYIQREGVKRLIAAFNDAGIEFASATVAVRTVGGPDDIAAAAAAAAKLRRPN